MMRKYLSCTPPTNAMIRNMNMNISTVPSSPCIWMTATGIAMCITSVITPAKLCSSSISLSVCRCFENVMIKRTFTSSDGCTDIPPGRVIHAVSSVPVTLRPITNTSSSKPSARAISTIHSLAKCS